MSWIGTRFGMGKAYYMVLDRNALGGIQVAPSEYPSDSQAWFQWYQRLIVSGWWLVHVPECPYQCSILDAHKVGELFCLRLQDSHSQYPSFIVGEFLERENVFILQSMFPFHKSNFHKLLCPHNELCLCCCHGDGLDCKVSMTSGNAVKLDDVTV